MKRYEKFKRNIYMLIPILFISALIIWTHKRTLQEVQQFHENLHVQASLRDETDQQRHVEARQEGLLLYTRRKFDLFKYVEPDIAGNGTFKEELQRYVQFLSTQGVVCQNIRHFGGKYNKVKPEIDPDGAWYICLDPEIELKKNNCLVYSIGISNDWSFDESISKEYGCNVYAFDPTINKEDHFHTPKIQFFNIGLADSDSEGNPGVKGRGGWKTRTLKSIIKKLGHENKLIDVLKIDIEGDEWKCLPQMLADGTLRKYVKQINLEFHVSNRPELARRYYGISKWLDRQGFKISFFHKNMLCGVCYEISHINTHMVKLPIH